MASGTVAQPLGVVNFTNQCTFPKGTPAVCTAVAYGKLVVVSYQGPAGTYANYDVLVSLPSKYAPSVHTVGSCSLNNTAAGTVNVENGAIALGFAPSGTGRVYFQVCYFIA